MGNALSIVILCIAFFILLAYLFFLIKKEGLEHAVIDLIYAAEKTFNYGENKAKLQWVVDELIKLIPAPFNMFISSESIINFIEGIFEIVKPLLDYGREEE